MLLGQSILNGEPREGTGAAFQGLDPATGNVLIPCITRSRSTMSIWRRGWPTMPSRSPASSPARRRRDSCATLPQALKPSRPRSWSGPTARRRCRCRGCRVRWAAPSTSSSLFAQVVEEGSWAMARIDPAMPERKPLPQGRYSLGAAAARAGSGLRVEQFSAGVFCSGRRYSFGVCRRQSGHRQGALGASRHQRDGGAGHCEQREGVRAAAGDVCAVIWFGFSGGFGAGGASQRKGGRALPGLSMRAGP